MKQVFQSKEEWLAFRQKGLGASDTPVALGISPHQSPYELWAQKRGLLQRSETSEAMFWGNALEGAIIDGFAQRNPQYEVQRWDEKIVYVDDKQNFMLCTPDAFATYNGERMSLQAKNVTAFKAGDWRGSAPLHYQAQAQHEMAVLGCNACLLVALIGGNSLNVIVVERNDNYIAYLREQAALFWESVKTGVEPSPQWAESVDINTWQKLHPDGNGDVVTLPPEAVVWHEDIQRMSDIIDQAEEHKEALQDKIKLAIGDATFGELPGVGKYTYKKRERKAYAVAAASYRELRFSKAKTKGAI